MNGFSYDDASYDSNDYEWSVPDSEMFSMKQDQEQEQPFTDLMPDQCSFFVEPDSSSPCEIKPELLISMELPTLSSGNSSVSSGSSVNSPSNSSSSPATPVVVSKQNALPEGLELPAILGGEMPPRPHRNMATAHESKSESGEDYDSEERRLVRLPRSTLLQITTPQINQYQRYLMGRMNLTEAQIDEIRRQKKLVKNRESATRIRRRKAKTLSEITAENRVLKEQLDRLSDENSKLRNELNWYRTHVPMDFNPSCNNHSVNTVRMPGFFFWAVLFCLASIVPLTFFELRNSDDSYSQLSRTFTEADRCSTETESQSLSGLSDHRFEAGLSSDFVATQWKPQDGIGYVAVRNVVPSANDFGAVNSESTKLGFIITGSMLNDALENSTISSKTRDLLKQHGEDTIDVQCSISQLFVIPRDSVPKQYLPGLQHSNQGTVPQK